MIMSCWLQHPNKRPTFSKLSELLDKYLEELAGYMNMGCLFPEMQHQQDPKAVQEKVGRRRSSAVTGTQREPTTAEKNFAVSINVVSPEGSTSFLY